MRTRKWLIIVAAASLSMYQNANAQNTDVEGKNPRQIPMIPSITSGPVESAIHATEITITWKTKLPANSIVKYGVTAAYTDSVKAVEMVTNHSMTLTSLRPCTIYHYQVGSADSTGISYSGGALFSTASTSTGIINVYFNQSVNPSIALNDTAQVVSPVSKLLARFSQAQYSIDVCLYSLSGSVGAAIASSLLDAKKRGVKIRVIGEHDNVVSTAPWKTLSSGGITVIDDAFDAINAGKGLMHNKFVVIDGRDSSAVNDWVWTGSWNATDPGNTDDAQNVVEIQDQALAQAYTVEFSEMWGSDNDTPNASNSRFGARKLDNTPHRFSVAGTPVELFFSPSDQTTYQIYYSLAAATSSINVALLTFTRTDLAQVLAERKNAGKKVRVIMDNKTDPGNQYLYLSGKVDVIVKLASVSGLFHHKYAIIDADNPQADNIVITGSHNWTTSAETENNENTLIIHSRRIANLFLQEFKKRYEDYGGKDNITTLMGERSLRQPGAASLQQNYPNPFNPVTRIRYSVHTSGFVSMVVYDSMGKVVATLSQQYEEAGDHEIAFDGSLLSTGVYWYRIRTCEFSIARPMILLR